MVLSLRIAALVILTFIQAECKAPPGYIKPAEVPDKNPPKYQYGYNIADEKGQSQGKSERRDGIFSQGRYYVQGTESSQNVRYYTDDWGYHPLVEYSNTGPHSRAQTHFALGEEAVKAFRNEKTNLHQSSQLLHHELLPIPQAQVLVQSNPTQQHQQIFFQQPPQQYILQQQPHIILQHQPQFLIQQQDAVSHQSVAQEESVSIEKNLVESRENLEQSSISATPQYESTVVTQTAAAIGGSEITQQNNYEETVLNQEHVGGYGSKLDVSLVPSSTPSYLVKNTLSHAPTKLIESTRNLISGEDVLNINEAITRNLESTSQNTIAQSIVSEYGSSTIHQSNNNLVTKVEINNELQQPIIATTPLSSNIFRQPIVVAEFQDNSVKSTTERYEVKEESHEKSYSTTGSTIGTVSVTEPSTILVTPKTVTTDFTAPFNSGVQLQSLEHDSVIRNQQNNIVVDVQKSLPYYLGKYEYRRNPNVQIHQENIELTKTLLDLPNIFSPHAEALVQKLPEVQVHQQFVDNNVEIDQQIAQHQQQEVSVQQVIQPIVQTKVVEKPVEYTKVINQPYPVEVPVHVPYAVEKPVPVPVQVERIVEKPVHIPHYIEKYIPKPYPVEKIVEKPIHVPYEVTKYIDRPYPVQVPVPQPYPVEKIVKQPYPVEVPVPQYIEKHIPVEKIVDRPIHHYIDRPYPVEVKIPVPVPQAYVLPVEVHKPYPVQVTKHVLKPYGYPQPYPVNQYVPIEVKVPYVVNRDQIGQHQHTYGTFYTKPYGYGSNQVKEYLTSKQENSLKAYLPAKESKPNNEYLPSRDCEPVRSASAVNLYYTIKPDDYIGLLPPKLPHTQIGKYSRKYRSARSNFNGNLRMEYGFMPPLIPSVEIDENGHPLDKGE